MRSFCRDVNSLCVSLWRLQLWPPTHIRSHPEESQVIFITGDLEIDLSGKLIQYGDIHLYPVTVFSDLSHCSVLQILVWQQGSRRRVQKEEPSRVAEPSGEGLLLGAFACSSSQGGFQPSQLSPFLSQLSLQLSLARGFPSGETDEVVGLVVGQGASFEAFHQLLEASLQQLAGSIRDGDSFLLSFAACLGGSVAACDLLRGFGFAGCSHSLGPPVF